MSFVDDLSLVDPSTVEQVGPLYVMGQWMNGDPKLAAMGGVVHTGGLVIDRKYLSDGVIPAPGWVSAQVAFESGKSSAMLAAQKPRLAVIRTRFRWFVTYNGVTTYYPRNAYQADSGMRGHLQALCGVNGFDFPIVFTFKGMASKHAEVALREWAQKVKESTKGAQWPRFAFYMPLLPGAHQKVGQKGQESVVTPPTLDAPAVMGEDYLSKVYVGRARLQTMQEEYKRAAEWAAQWDKGQPATEPQDDDDQGGPLDGLDYADADDMQDIGAVRVPLATQATFGAGNPPRNPSTYQAGR